MAIYISSFRVTCCGRTGLLYLFLSAFFFPRSLVYLPHVASKDMMIMMMMAHLRCVLYIEKKR